MTEWLVTAGWGDAVTDVSCAEDGAGPAPAVATCVPHCPQKRAPGSIGVPQLEHASASLVPQDRQNF